MTKTKKLSSAAFKSAKDMATTVTGYNDASPIWGKRLPEVLDIIQINLETAALRIDDGDLLTAQNHLTVGSSVLIELKKRLAKNAVIAQARHG